MTLEMLVSRHQQREGDCFSIIARVTHMPESEMQALKALAQFHIESLRLLQKL